MLKFHKRKLKHSSQLFPKYYLIRIRNHFSLLDTKCLLNTQSTLNTSKASSIQQMLSKAQPAMRESGAPQPHTAVHRRRRGL